MRIYVASSWRNAYQQEVVKQLREAGHEVYDFKNPPGGTGFDWGDVDPHWQKWNNQQYIEALSHPISERGFASDFTAMREADACVLVMPCGRSAHVEAGFMQGAGLPTFILLDQKEAEPELMYKMFEMVTDSLDDIIGGLETLQLMSAINPVQ